MSAALLAACALAGPARFREESAVRLAPTRECWPSSQAGELSYDLVFDIAVASAPARQQAIRESWASAHAPGTACSVMHVYVHSIPAPTVRHRRTGDEVVLFLNTTDTYERLPVKVIGSLQWLSAHVAFKYVLKTDDDAWICTHALLATLADFPRERLYWGKMNTNHAEIAGVTHHGFVHTNFSAFFKGVRHYPTYAFGAFYALSADVAALISDEAALDAAEHVQIEDVLVGELIRRRLGGSANVRDARVSPVDLGYSRHKTPKGMDPLGREKLRFLCSPKRRKGGKGAIIVHRIFPQQVRACAEMAADRCACDGRAGRCAGLPPGSDDPAIDAGPAARQDLRL